MMKENVELALQSFSSLNCVPSGALAHHGILLCVYYTDTLVKEQSRMEVPLSITRICVEYSMHVFDKIRYDKVRNKKNFA